MYCLLKLVFGHFGVVHSEARWWLLIEEHFSNPCGFGVEGCSLHVPMIQRPHGAHTKLLPESLPAWV